MPGESVCIRPAQCVPRQYAPAHHAPERMMSCARRIIALPAALLAVVALTPIALAADKFGGNAVDRAQVPDWSAEDLRFFLHGSMSTEVVPENVLKAFRATYPELLGQDWAAFGLIADPADELPIGLSRREVSHLGGLRSVGINCAACHVAQVGLPGGEVVYLLGAASHFDVEAFFGAIAAATFQTTDPANMARFLAHYLNACDPQAPAAARELLTTELLRQREALAAAIASELAQERALPPDKLYELDRSSLTLDARALEKNRNLTPLVQSLLRLFHNMRAALHVPQKPPEALPPRSGPGRNNAFGLLSLALFGEPTIFGPVKFGITWELRGRTWVHWDGNTRSPIVRNLAAALGLGAPMIGKHGVLDFAAVERHTRLSEQIRAPKYPGKIDAALAERGRRHFEANCAKCHAPASGEDRLYAVEDVKTDPNRAKLFTEHQAQLYNRLFAELEVDGYEPAREPPVRSTGKYVASELAGVWARSPYLHNGAVRTVRELLTPATQRARSFHRGTRTYDEKNMGYADEGAYVLESAAEGNSNGGHEYGVELGDEQKRELVEYLKTL